ncbi:hypothetical protein L2E82_12305 [Cichorium intybus]|uniref:Uncharacterized protein n=1 Tax=Cichorium intybus TaxID=13427 RepID=A0ACB9GFQ2_CICIN|nr:hypothetical protein L2E82_12305 [Cichorium intybus]
MVKKVSITDLEGKTVGLYFVLLSFKKSTDFTPTLIDIYNELKSKQENLEIVMSSLDDDGVSAYPFTPDKLAELEKIKKSKQETQTLDGACSRKGDQLRSKRKKGNMQFGRTPNASETALEENSSIELGERREPLWITSILIEIVVVPHGQPVFI